jgi:hypothetical protein
MSRTREEYIGSPATGEREQLEGCLQDASETTKYQIVESAINNIDC